ncbi:ORF14 [Pigeon adenovirus 2a]|nr:ORF14 [Pigeon adenovirus 2a]
MAINTVSVLSSERGLQHQNEEETQPLYHNTYLYIEPLLTHVSVHSYFTPKFIRLLNGLETIALRSKDLPCRLPFRSVHVRLLQTWTVWLIDVLCDCHKPYSLFCNSLRVIALQRWADKFTPYTSDILPLMSLGVCPPVLRHCVWCADNPHRVLDAFLNNPLFHVHVRVEIGERSILLRLPNVLRLLPQFSCLNALTNSSRFPLPLHLCFYPLPGI